MKNFVDEKWLKENMDSVKIVDVRGDYEEGHIPGAISLPFERYFVDTPSTHGGRNPFPSVEDMEKYLGGVGLKLDDDIICYDEDQWERATRATWMMRNLGFKNVRVLIGGFKAWKKAGNEISTDMVKPEVNDELELEYNMDYIVDMEYVRDKAVPNDDIALVDARAKERFDGESEPFDFIIGHIPNALNFHSHSFVTEDSVADKEELEETFKELKDYDEVVVYCGSGHAATVILLLLDEVGIEGKIYPGSFSDWISYPENEVITKGNKKQLVKDCERVNQ